MRGDLYMSSLASFWWGGSDEQRDIFEGSIATVPLEHCGIRYQGLKDEYQAFEQHVLPVGLGYCNVCCFSMQIVRDLCLRDLIGESPSLDLGLGKYIVCIDDAGVFVERVMRAVETQGFKCAMGPVSYYKESPLRDDVEGNIVLKCREPYPISSIIPDGCTNLNIGPFSKPAKYRGQYEWRIALYRGVKSEDAYTLRVGNLKGICHLTERSNLDEDLKVAIGRPEAWINKGYYGNTTKEDLVRDFIDLGDGMAYHTVTIG